MQLKYFGRYCAAAGIWFSPRGLRGVADSLVVLAVGPTYKAEGAVLLLPPGTTVKRASSSGSSWAIRGCH